MQYILVFFLFTTDGQLIKKTQQVMPSLEVCYEQQRYLDVRKPYVGFASCVPA